MLKANDSIIRTVADELFELVKKAKRISVEDAAKQLKVPITTVQTLVDFLVEEKVFGIEYKFTTPYIYLYRDSLQQAKSKDKSFTKGLVTKENGSGSENTLGTVRSRKLGPKNGRWGRPNSR